MKRFGYLDRLSLAAKWVLPQGQADEMKEDYRDILAELPPGRDPREMFGPPERLPLTRVKPKSLRRWHIVLGILLFCVFFPVFSGFFFAPGGTMYDEALFFECLFSILLIWGCLELIWAGSFQKPVRIVLYAVTAALAFILAGIGPIDAYTAWIWIHFTHSKSFSLNVELLLTFITLCYSLLPLFYFGFRRISQRGFPKALKICLPLSFLAVGGLIGWFFYSKASGLLLGKNDIFVMLCWVGVAVYRIGAVVGILLARLWDRRWRAMYILCLTGLLICQEILPVLTAVSEGRIDPAYIGSSAYFNDMRLLSQSVLRFAVAGGAASLIGLI